MAPLDSPLTSYSDTTTQKRVITDVISIIDPTDAPMIDALGGLDGASGKFRFLNEKSTVVEWLEDTMPPLADALNGSITSTATTVTIDDGSIVQEGHIIAIENEHVWVSDVNTTTNVITVTRAFAGSTAATHDNDVAITIIGMARLEGDDSDDIAFTDRTTNSNYTQIWHGEVKVSRTHRQLAQYGISDEMMYQENKQVPGLMRQMERDWYYISSVSAGSATTPRVMGGIKHFITTNKVAGTSLTQSMFETAILSAYTSGGTGPWLAFLSPTNYQKVNNFYANNSVYLRTSGTETQMGQVFRRIVTPFGDVDLVLDRWAKSTEIPLVDPKHAGWKTYYPFTVEPLVKTGDYDRSEVVGEFTFCLRQQKAHAILTAVS